jgi:hypothetical protein
MKRTAITRPKPQPGILRTASLKAGKPTLAAKPRMRKCAICRTPFAARSMTHKACSEACAAAVAKQVREKAERKELKARKEAIKTRADWLKEAQIEFNGYIRDRDRKAGYPCISSGKSLQWNAAGGHQVDAGHYRSVGSAPHLRFDERNCHAQSVQDNRYGSGCAVDYRIGLIARIGLEAVEALEADNTPRKYTIEELKAIKAEYRAKRKALATDKGVE